MIEDHRHCVVCGKPTSPDKFFCSPSCEEIFKKQQKRMARFRMVMMILLAALFFLIVVMSSLRSPG